MTRWLATATLAILAGGAAWGQSAPVDPARVVVIRESGRPEIRCVIEETLQQSDGHTTYLVRDLATGERMRVVDNRTSKDGRGPIVGQLISRLSAPGDADMTRALASSPSQARPIPHPPTPAELAGSSAKGAPAAKFKRGGPSRQTTSAVNVSPVQVQLTQLKGAATPSQREVAAMTLVLSEARTVPEVVKALIDAAKTDPAASVRVCCIRCLYRLAKDVPDVAPVLETLTADLNAEVAETARLALREMANR